MSTYYNHFTGSGADGSDVAEDYVQNYEDPSLEEQIRRLTYLVGCVADAAGIDLSSYIAGSNYTFKGKDSYG